MADYYPLLSKAVAALPSSTPETRSAIYGRARNALMTQLRSEALGMSEEDIDREAKALDETVGRIEREWQRRKAEAPQAARAPVNPDSRPGSLSPSPPKPSGSMRPVPGKSDKLDTAVARMRQQATATPKPPESRVKSSSARFFIVFATLIALVAVIGATAYLLRDRPEDLARMKASTLVRKTDIDAGKITSRADGPKGEPSNPVPTIKVETIPIRRQDAAPTPKLPVPANESQPTTPVAPPTKAEAVSPTTAATIPVAYRSALLIQTNDEPQKIKTYIGSVTWKTETVSGDPSQPLTVAVEASIDIPEAKLKATVTLKQNTDTAFPASHTIVLSFKLTPGSPVAKLKEMDAPQLRNEDSPVGEALIDVGIVPIMPDFFLVGLTTGEDNVAHNLALIKSKGWFDISMQLSDGKLAKLTFEKGVQGQQAINDALAAWH